MREISLVLFGSIVSLLAYVLLTFPFANKAETKVEKIYVDGGYVCFKTDHVHNCVEISKEEQLEALIEAFKEQGREQ